MFSSNAALIVVRVSSSGGYWLARPTSPVVGRDEVPTMTCTRLLACFAIFATLAVSGAAQSASAELKAARAAWDVGDYPKALTALLALLDGSQGEKLRREIALLTGEWHPVREIAKDARGLQISRDGRFASYSVPVDRRSRRAPTMRVVNLDGAVRVLVERQASASALAPDGSVVAFLATDRSNVAIVDLKTKKETVLTIPDMVFGSVSFAADATLLVVAGSPDGDRTDVYAFVRGESGYARPEKLTAGAGFKTNPQVDPTRRYVLYAETTSNPLARRTGRRRGFRRSRRGGTSKFVIRDRRSEKQHEFAGAGPRIAPDGSRVVFGAAGESGVSKLRAITLHSQEHLHEFILCFGIFSAPADQP